MAKIIECQQGDEAWITARLGIPTASEFHRIVTPTGRRNKDTSSLLSAQARPYAYRLIAEALLKQQTQSLDDIEAVEHGKMSEGDAVKVYEFLHEVETKKVGFITTNDGSAGCSPDRLLPGNRGLECKCPFAPHVHIGYLLDGPGDKYKTQVQGQNYVAEFEYVDFFSHHLSFKPCEIRTYRDEPFIKLLAEGLDEFNHMKADMMERIRKEGFFVERERIQTAADTEYSANLGRQYVVPGEMKF